MKTCLRQSKALVYLLLSLIFIHCESPKSYPIKEVVVPKEVSTTRSIISKNKSFQHYCVKVNYNSNNEFELVASLLTGDGLNDNYKKIYDFLHWEIYHEFIDISWRKLEKQRLNKIKKWRQKELAITDTLTHTVFYPFSGPDFLTASLMFPSADTFILLGLEPVGVLPNFHRMSAQSQQEYLSSFSNSLGDIFHKSYFITRKMLNDFQTQKLNGLLSVLCFFIKKLDYNIADLKYIYKDSLNQIREIDYFSKTIQKPFGVKITALKDSCAKTIYYFRYNVMDKLFNDSTIFYQYLSKYNNYITYIKSASYLLHNSFMKNMRDLILTHSVAILQDDTGIPYKFLSDNTQWALKLYGEYTKPVKDFGEMGYQPDLAQRMKEDSAFIPKIPFHLGYHWGSKKDVLLFAVKNKIYEHP